jgi:hypothetical protein
MFTFKCEKCGGEFYSKADPSGWRHKYCNACSGKPYKDYPVDTTTVQAPKPVPVKPVYNQVATQQAPKKEFNLDEYIMDIISTYEALSMACDEAKLTIPVDNLCQWTTSIMIQKGRLS